MNLQRKLLACIRKADCDFNLINENDEILVGLSGGKDSVLLCYLLSLYQKFSSKHFTFKAVFLDLGFEMSPEFEKIEKFLNKIGVDLIKEDEHQVSTILNLHKKKDGLLPCSICSRMKKAAINNVAHRLQFKKVCFAHHMDDAIETLFLNMTYGGKVATFEPKMHLSKANITFIRPLIYVREDDVNKAVEVFNLPICKNKCPNDKNTQREEFKKLLKEYYEKFPEAYLNFANMLINLESFKLFFENFGYTTENDIFIKKVVTKNDFLDSISVKNEVFLKEQNISFDDEFDSKEKESIYFNAYIKNKPVGCLRIYFTDDNTVCMGRFAVLKEFRNNHIGTKLFYYVIYYLTNNVTPLTVKINAQYSKMDFYKKLGFKIVENSENIEANIKHVRMFIKYDMPIAGNLINKKTAK